MRCDAVEVSPWAGIRLQGVRVPLPAGQSGSVRIESVDLRPSGIFPPKGRVNLSNADFGENSAESLLAFVLGKTIQEIRFEIEKHPDKIELKNILFQSDLLRFEGGAILQPASPLRSAVLQVKGEAKTAERTFTVDKSFPVSDFLPPE